MMVLTNLLNMVRFNSKNWKAIGLCFFAATIFWFFNALNKNYTTNINFPLEFEYDHEAYIPVQPLPTQVRINVTGMGWDLFRRSSGLKVPALVIPLEKPSEVKKIVSQPALFAHQLERFEINFVLTDTFSVNVEPKAERWVTLRLDPKSIKLRDNFIRISEPVLAPDSIFVEGPLSLVQGFIEPVYLKLADNNIDENYQEDVEVEFLNNDLIKRNPPTVSVKFKVDKLIQINDSIPLSVINFPKGANPHLGIKALPCKFSIPESLMSQYHPDSVMALIDLKFFVRGTKRIKPDITGLPPYSQVNSIDSVFVKF
jgi:hypothetical protein